MADRLALCYHAVSERWPAALSATPAALEAQLRFLAGHNYRAAGFTELVAGAKGKGVAITFDDAFRSVFDIAFPMMSDLGLTGTVFVVTAFPDTAAPMSWAGVDQWIGGEFEHEMEPMSWEQLGQLQDAGWEVGSHTHSHPRLTTLDDDELVDELERSRAICSERMGRDCRSIAYPYGDHNARVVAAADAAGYTTACTLPSRPHRPEPLRWPRVGVYHADTLSRFRAKVSPLVRRVRADRERLA
jgi:peptidoglycan/xylan/chitin deacetylase (PgdA/CDA1 family)